MKVIIHKIKLVTMFAKLNTQDFFPLTDITFEEYSQGNIYLQIYSYSHLTDPRF